MRKIKAMVFFVLLALFLVLLMLPVGGTEYTRITGRWDSTPFGIDGCYCGFTPITCHCVIIK